MKHRERNLDSDQWLHIYQDLSVFGEESSPRGQKIKELENFSFIGDPYNRFANFFERKLNLRYIIAEFCWYLRGDPNDLSIIQYAKFWDKIKNDKEPIFNSNYGKYIFKDGQFNYCIDQLKKDKDTRQAVIIIANSEVMMSDSKDKICTYSMSFRIRKNKFNCSVSMRSNDFIRGTQNDYFQFTAIQELMLKILQDEYPDLEMGSYFHHADSLHIYEPHFGMMEEIIKNDGSNWSHVDFPKIKNSAEAKFIIEALPSIEEKIRRKDDIEIVLKHMEDGGYLFTKRCIDCLIFGG